MSLAVAQVEARPGSLAESVAAHVRMAGAAADNRAELVIFPELSLTGYSRALTREDAIDIGAPALQPLADVARARGITIVAGTPVASNAGLLISSVAWCSDGRIATYIKQHLHEGEERTFVAGNGGNLLAIGGRKVGLAICAEINNASHMARTIERGAEVYAASCFLTPSGYDADCRRLRECATVHGVVVLMANFAGPSGGFESAGGSSIWDGTGRLLAAAPSAGQYLVLAERQNGRWSGHLVAVA